MKAGPRAFEGSERWATHGIGSNNNDNRLYQNLLIRSTHTLIQTRSIRADQGIEFVVVR